MRKLIIILIVIAVFLIGFLVARTKYAVNIDVDTPRDQPNQTASWQQYSDTSLKFQYPDLISVDNDRGTVTLNHSIAHRHVNPCDFKGDAPPLERLTDFDVTFKILRKNLKETVQINEGSDYIIENFFENGTLKLSPGFIDPFETGSLKGFQIFSGVEGCGQITYYFPISATETLFVKRELIAEFGPAIGDNQTYLALPGIIAPDQEMEFFTKILSSVTFN